MNIIVLDLEFTSINKEHKQEKRISKYEIIQIGAVKIGPSNEIEDTFSTFVQPEYSNVSEKVTELTGISDEMLQGAPDYTEAMDMFFVWIGEEDAIINSWSKTDKEQIINESLLKVYYNNRLDEMLDKWVDFQVVYGAMLGFNSQLSLKNAIQSVDYDFKGSQHSALNDAYNTAELLILTKDEKEFKKKAAPVVDLFKESEPLTYSLADKLKGIKIA